jgi:hypothetical protein
MQLSTEQQHLAGLILFIVLCISAENSPAVHVLFCSEHRIGFSWANTTCCIKTVLEYHSKTTHNKIYIYISQYSTVAGCIKLARCKAILSQKAFGNHKRNGLGSDRVNFSCYLPQLVFLVFPCSQTVHQMSLDIAPCRTDRFFADILRSASGL